MSEDERKYKQVAQDIEQFLSLVGVHQFTADQVDRQYNYKTRDAKRYRWQVLERYVGSGRLEKRGTGKYRLFDGALEEIEFMSASVENKIQIAWPLNLQKYIRTYHQSIIIIAGAPGSGKTGFLYDFTLRNMNHPMGVVIFSNDMTAEEMKERMLNSDTEIPDPVPFKVWERYDNFSDVIEPDKINVIDYLDLNSEVYLIGDEIEKIYRKLRRGIAIIAIQKRPGQDIGLGGLFSWKRAKLYLSLDVSKEFGELINKLKIVKARGRADPMVNPTGMEFKFHLVGGIKFVLKSDIKQEG